MNPYKILGVGADASQVEIQRAYREKAEKHHPDLGGDGWAFQQVQDAYEALTNPTPRQQPPTPERRPDARELRPDSLDSKPDRNRRSKNPADKSRSTPKSTHSTNRTSWGRSGPKETTEHNWRNLLTGHLPLQTETTTFILVNCLDIYLTYLIFRTTWGAKEANPIADYFYQRWDIHGLIAFKLIIVAVVVVIAQVVAIKKMKTARLLLLAGSALVGCVVVYSVALFVKHLA